ncbi:hypothetical protein, partial [Enterococcus faecalis]|uniref:hypothetical protein n=1 Tax=Enterococcus faecalis TaxID=1351 RepID=UPI0022F07D76
MSGSMVSLERKKSNFPLVFQLFRRISASGRNRHLRPVRDHVHERQIDQPSDSDDGQAARGEGASETDT